MQVNDFYVSSYIFTIKYFTIRKYISLDNLVLE